MKIRKKLLIAGAAAALIFGAIFFYISNLPVPFPDLEMSRAKIGKASWYSESDPGINEHTASGEVFDESDITCASWDYNFGQKLLIVNPATGARVTCRVNDRGPAKRLKRAIDLSKASFSQIARHKKGLVSVIIIPVAD